MQIYTPLGANIYTSDKGGVDTGTKNSGGFIGVESEISS